MNIQTVTVPNLVILRQRSPRRQPGTPNEEPALSLPKGPMQAAGGADVAGG